MSHGQEISSAHKMMAMTPNPHHSHVANAGKEYDADVIVVGSGVIGSLASDDLAARGKAVIQLEAGPRVPRWKIVDTFRTCAKVSTNGPAGANGVPSGILPAVTSQSQLRCDR